MSDRALLQAWRGGDKLAGTTLFERYYPPVSRFFVNKAGDDAPDLIQKTFLRCLETCERMRESTTFRCYLFGVARMVLLEHYRFKRKVRERIDFTQVSAEDFGPTPNTVIAQLREEQVLLRALRRIPLEYQVTLELYFWEGLTAREIGEIAGVAEGTTRTRIRRAKKRLRKEIERLAAEPALLQSTLHNLDSWADKLRARMDRGG